MISIINYGMGNLGSIQNMLKKIGTKSQIINSPEECITAEKIIFPGVGHFEEGNCKGLNWIDANVKHFKLEDQNLKVPHMGWNEVEPKFSSPLFEDFENLEDIRYYHVHSYFVELGDPKYEISKTVYGIPFTSGFQNENIYGVQFHPEKSHKYGLKMLSNFSKI